MLTCKVHTHTCTHSEYTHTQKGREGERREWERGGRGGRGEEREREHTVASFTFKSARRLVLVVYSI